MSGLAHITGLLARIAQSAMRRARQSLVCLFLLTTLAANLAVPLAAFAALTNADSCTCCKGKRACSCRRTGSHGHGAGWQAGMTCNADCAKAPGIAPSPAGIAPAMSSLAIFRAASISKQLLSRADTSEALDARLYQRPPPQI
jgi:hypothetical protein